MQYPIILKYIFYVYFLALVDILQAYTNKIFKYSK